MSESAPENPMSVENPRPIDERQVARAVEKLQGEFAGSSAIREEDVKKAVAQASGEAVPPPVAQPTAQEHTLHDFGRIRTDEEGKPLPEDLPPSVRAQGEIENQLQEQRLGRDLGGGLESPGESLQQMREIEEMLGVDRLRRERETQLRYHEGALTPEAFRTSYDPQVIKEAARDYMADNEDTLLMPAPHRVTLARDQLRDRAKNFRRALNPGGKYDIFRPQLAEWGLVEKKELVPSYQRTAWGDFELTIPKEDRGKLSVGPEGLREEANGDVRVLLTVEQMRKLWANPVGQELLEKKRAITIPPVVPKERLPGVIKICEDTRDEVWARERLFIMSVLYSQAQGQLDKECQLFEDQRYTRFTMKDWQSIFRFDETKPGERKLGDKIEAAMRLYNLLGIGGGPGGVDGAKRRIEAEIQDKPWLDGWITGLVGADKKQEFLDKLAEFSTRNIFSDVQGYEESSTRDEEWVEEVRGWVRKTVGGDEDDTMAADELSWRVFFMWGLASHWDGRKKIEKDDVSGWPSSDDKMKLEHVEAYRRRERNGHNYGPHATLGKYDEMAAQYLVLPEAGGQPEFSMSVSFLHWATPFIKDGRDLKVKEMRSFYERWWNEGTRMADLPWVSMRKYSWWSYHLGLYFAGGYRDRDDRNLYKLLNKDSWRREELINTNTLQDINRSIDYAVRGGWVITKGEIQKWLEFSSKPENKNVIVSLIEEVNKERKLQGKKSLPEDVGELTSSEFTEVLSRPLQKRIKELFLLGAITSAYASNSYIETEEKWALWWENLGYPNNAEYYTKRGAFQRQKEDTLAIIVRSGFLLPQEWDKVVREAEGFLQSPQIKVFKRSKGV